MLPTSPASPQIGARISRIAVVLVSNAIPLIGVLHYGWSATNVLVLYWLENLLVAVFTCLRIAAHCRLTHRRGHWRTDQLASSPGAFGRKPVMLRDYALIAFVFTLAHGIFVFCIAFLIASKHADSPMWHFTFASLRQGALILLATLAIDFCIDLAGLRSRSFAWIKGYTQQRMGRVLILHLAIIFGMFVMAATGSPFSVLYALIGLKTLWDLATSRVIVASATTAAAPPRWLLKVGDRMAKDKGGSAVLAKQWTVEREAANIRAVEDEQVMAG